jgi:hypothetical protein
VAPDTEREKGDLVPGCTCMVPRTNFIQEWAVFDEANVINYIVVTSDRIVNGNSYTPTRGFGH